MTFNWETDHESCLDRFVKTDDDGSNPKPFCNLCGKHPEVIPQNINCEESNCPKVEEEAEE